MFRQEVLENDADIEDQFAECGTTVPSNMYLAIRKTDNSLVGIIDIRHHINHPILGTWGGHCGYSVRPKERGKGYTKDVTIKYRKCKKNWNCRIANNM